MDIKNKCNIFMSCKECSQSVMPVAAMKKGASIGAKAIVSKIENKHTDLEKTMERIDDSLSKESKCSKVEIVRRSYIRSAGIVKQNTSTEEQFKKVSKVLSNPAVNAKDIVTYEEQEKSLTYFSVSESKKDTFKSRFKEDETFVKNFISERLHLPAQTIQSAFRLGKVFADKKRPIKVIFQHKSRQVLI